MTVPFWAFVLTHPLSNPTCNADMIQNVIESPEVGETIKFLTKRVLMAVLSE